MAFSFVPWFQKFTPSWLQRRVGSGFLGSVGASLDGVLTKAEMVVAQKSPLTCDASALSRHAKDRRIRRYTTETELSHRIRLAKWLQIHRTAGSNYGVLRQLRILLLPYGRPLLRIVHQSGDPGDGFGPYATWSTLVSGTPAIDYFGVPSTDPEHAMVNVRPSNWVWDGATSHRSRLWVFVYTEGAENLVSPIQYGSGENWGGGGQWGGTFPKAVTDDAIQLCRDWIAPHSALWGFAVVTDSSALNPDNGYTGGNGGSIAEWPQSVRWRLNRGNLP